MNKRIAILAFISIWILGIAVSGFRHKVTAQEPILQLQGSFGNSGEAKLSNGLSMHYTLGESIPSGATISKGLNLCLGQLCITASTFDPIFTIFLPYIHR